jgi:hypothetical protein
VKAGVEDAAVVGRLVLADVSLFLEDSYSIVAASCFEFVCGCKAD